VIEGIFAVLYVSHMGLTHCYKTSPDYIVPRMRTKIQYGGRRHIENRKIAITLQPFIRSRRNFARTRRSWP